MHALLDCWLHKLSVSIVLLLTQLLHCAAAASNGAQIAQRQHITPKALNNECMPKFMCVFMCMHRWRMPCTPLLSPHPQAQSPTWWRTARALQHCWSWTHRNVKGLSSHCYSAVRHPCPAGTQAGADQDLKAGLVRDTAQSTWCPARLTGCAVWHVAVVPLACT